MSRNLRQSNKKSSVRSGKTSSLSQDLADFDSQTENENNSDKELNIVLNCLNSQLSDRIGVRKSTELGDYYKQMSQTSADRTDEWKGSQVINYKTFKKVSQNSSQTSDKNEETIALKRVKVDLNSISSETDYKIEGKSLDSKKCNKRKIDANVETIKESGAQKKSRH